LSRHRSPNIQGSDNFGPALNGWFARGIGLGYTKA